jgi:hypothetical protein
MWTPHTIDAYTLDFAQDHHQLLPFWNKLTGGPVINGIYTLYPAYFKLAVISEGDCTVAAVQKEQKKRDSIVKHSANLSTAVGIPITSEGDCPGTTTTQVAVAQTALYVPALHEEISTTPLLHQRQTQRNTP